MRYRAACPAWRSAIRPGTSFSAILTTAALPPRLSSAPRKAWPSIRTASGSTKFLATSSTGTSFPETAINRMTLMPSNPVYGLNALGGALSIEMKNGFTYQGADAELRGGSFGRRAAMVQAGGQAGNLSGYLTADAINDNGWRDYSPSRLRRIYADLALAATKPNSTSRSPARRITSAPPPQPRSSCSTGIGQARIRFLKRRRINWPF